MKKKGYGKPGEDENRSLLKYEAPNDSMAASNLNKSKLLNFEKSLNYYNILDKKKPKRESDETKTQMTKELDIDIFADYDRLPKPQTQMEVSEDHLLQKLVNHIVVCGIHSSIMHFVLPLRAKYLESKQQDIVIITPIQTIPSDIWDTISKFPRIYLINGSPLLVEVLRKAQIHKADKAVILGHDPTTNQSAELNDEMLDAQTIFIYKAIKKCKPNLQVLTELGFSSNIDFLQKNRNKQTEEF